MEELFKTIFNAVKALTFVKQVAADEGQLELVNDQGELQSTVLFPCVLVDVQSCEWEAGDNLEQYGTAVLYTRYAYRKTADQSNTTSSTLFTAAITALKKRIDVEKAVAKAAASAGNHGKAIRLTTERERRNDGIVVYRTMWGCSVKETLN